MEDFRVHLEEDTNSFEAPSVGVSWGRVSFRPKFIMCVWGEGISVCVGGGEGDKCVWGGGGG